MNMMVSSFRSMVAACAIATSLGMSSHAAADGKITTPDGFDSLVVYMGTGIFDPAVPEPRPGVVGCDGLFCDGLYFQKDVMQRTDEEIYNLTLEAKQFYLERFGIDVDDPDNDGRVSFDMFTLNPDFEYRLYAISGMKVPSQGWLIRDGGFKLEVIDPDGIELGGELAGTHAPFGAAMFFGNYNILVTNKNGKPKDELLIFYASDVPGEILPNGSFVFRCDMFNDELGQGLGLGTIANVPLDDGTVRANGRNIITFPPASNLLEFPENPTIGAHPKNN